MRALRPACWPWLMCREDLFDGLLFRRWMAHIEAWRSATGMPVIIIEVLSAAERWAAACVWGNDRRLLAKRRWAMNKVDDIIMPFPGGIVRSEGRLEGICRRNRASTRVARCG
jgi:hypothetical protein